VSLPPRLAALAGREELLGKLHALLTGDGAPRAVVLVGMGGVGKTSLAAEYAHRHLAEVGVAWQVRCEDPAVLAQDMAELAAQVGGRELADPRDPVASAHAVLAAFGSEWLLIFDNAPDGPSIRQFVPTAGPGRVVVTSQSQHWPGWYVLDVPVLDGEVAARFLVDRAADQDQSAAAALADELGRLPLALEQAAAYVQASAGTLAGYLALYRQRRAELLARGGAAGHPMSVAATLGVALVRLEADAPAAAGLLRLLACLAPEPVPLALLLPDADPSGKLDPDMPAALGPLIRDLLLIGDAVAMLRRYSLVTPAGDGMVLLHRLVAGFIFRQMPEQESRRYRKTAAGLIAAAIPPDASLPKTWPVFGVLYPHAQALLGEDSDALITIATYLGKSGQYAAARDQLQQIVAARTSRFGHDDRKTLTAVRRLAYWTGVAGDDARAWTMSRDLEQTCEQAPGAQDPDTLAARLEVAAWDPFPNPYIRRLDELTTLLPDLTRVCGADHPDTLEARYLEASCLWKTNDPARARDLYAELLPAVERVYGPDHPLTLRARGDLAGSTGEAGDPVRARDLYSQVLATEEWVLGSEHPTTLVARGNLARWTGEAGDAAGARDLYAELLAIRLRIPGARQDRATLRVLGGLAFWTEKAGDPALATFLSAVLTLCKYQLLPRKYPDDEMFMAQAWIDIDRYIQRAKKKKREQALSLASALLDPVS
jgi:hypothetical protein